MVINQCDVEETTAQTHKQLLSANQKKKETKRKEEEEKNRE